MDASPKRQRRDNAAISSISDPVVVGGALTISGIGFTAGSVANFFVATATGAINFGPLTPSAHSATSLTVLVPASKVTTLGHGVVSIEVVNTDQGFTHSNALMAQLQGDTGAGFPDLLKVNGVGLAATSTDPSYATGNVETVVTQGHAVALSGIGFDTAHISKMLRRGRRIDSDEFTLNILHKSWPLSLIFSPPGETRGSRLRSLFLQPARRACSRGQSCGH